jgi:hypothetical protein
MWRSALRYANYFTTTVFARPERKLLLRNAFSWCITKNWKTAHFTQSEKKDAMQAAAKWLINNQTFNRDKGFSTFYIVEGHTGSYPETSGYIIDSLYDYARQYKQLEILPALKDCADWLISIQKPSGGWQSGYVHENKAEVVFNTGQVIRGLIKAYRVTGEKKYLQSCQRACDWLCEIQERDGSWKKHAFMNVARVYDAYVDAPLLQVWAETGDMRYKEAAVKNLDWICNNKMRVNGWLEDCDNTIKHNDRPILHTIAYTLDGLIESSVLLNEKIYAAKAKKAADRLMAIFEAHGYLKGRYNSFWKPSEYMICTGGAQIALVWMKLFNLYGDPLYYKAAVAMNNLLVYIQRLTIDGRPEISGALQGSFPLWGKYEPFAFPNWATKYLLDSLMLEMELQ